MSTKLAVVITVVLAFLALTSSSRAAPIDIILRLDPDQSGPVYSWSLVLDVQEGHAVGAIDFLTSGLDSFTINTANAGISPLDSVFAIDPIGDGRNVLIINNTALGVAIASGPVTGALLGTFWSSNLEGVAIHPFEEFGSATLYDPLYRELPSSDFSIRIEGSPATPAIPESKHLGLASTLIAAITIALASHKRAHVTRR